MDFPDSMPLSIRPLKETDSIIALTDLLHRAYRALAEAGMHFMASHQDEAMTRRRIASGECFLALLDGDVIGTITLRGPHATSGTPWYDRPDVGSFGQFAVDPSHQRRGIGSLLLDTVDIALGSKEFLNSPATPPSRPGISSAITAAGDTVLLSTASGPM